MVEFETEAETRAYRLGLLHGVELRGEEVGHARRRHETIDWLRWLALLETWANLESWQTTTGPPPAPVK